MSTNSRRQSPKQSKQTKAVRPPAKSRSRKLSSFDVSKLALKMDLTIPARSAAIDPLVDAVMTAVRDQGSMKELEIETALREALANAIKHGCGGDPSKFVQCSVVFETDKNMLIVVRDPGTGFDPALIPDPTEGQHLLDDHGRGIYLIHSLMDEVSFKRNGSEIHMRSRY